MRLTIYGLTLLLLSACSRPAAADVIINFEEVGGNVRATYSGTLDLSGLSFTSGNSSLNVHRVGSTGGGRFINSYPHGSGVNQYTDPFASVPDVWKTGSFVNVNGGHGGDHFVVYNGGTNPLRLLASDITGTTWNGSGFLQWDSTTIAGLDLDLSVDRIWTLNNGSGDTITMSAVPEPSAAASLGLIGAVFSLRRRRRASGNRKRERS